MKVAIFFGSKSDTEVMRSAAVALKEFSVEYESFILSAHRVPEKLAMTLKTIHNKGCEVIIAGAGLAAHLPGVIASQTILPVIGVPINAAVGGLDSLFSIVQMPKAIPVATVGINNSYNAGMLAIQILALKYPKINARLIKYRHDMKEKFLSDNSKGAKL
jgi:5-(carboxyamino)imidazole ribonucleotide mutase